jgi:hypothetical protein
MMNSLIRLCRSALCAPRKVNSCLPGSSLVLPAKGLDVFVDEITHILIICTASRLTLLGLSHPSPREVSLYHTQLTADLPTSILAISGTHSGRIFMTGSNKDLYEVEYSNSSGWFFGSGAKVAVHNRSSGGLSNWIPSVFSSSSASFRHSLRHVI